MTKLGLKYFFGDGVPKDEIEGLAWLIYKTTIGRDTEGHEDSMGHRKQVETSLGHEKTLAAERRSSEIRDAMKAARKPTTR